MASDSTATSCKVVLLGESGVGKSCIINRFIHDSFTDITISTKGASYAAKSMTFNEYEGKSLKFEIWDTAGQERFRALNKIFYKDAAIAVLVYDITRKDSFEEIKKYWYKALCDNAPKNLGKLNTLLYIVFAIAANKNDLYEHEQVDEDKARTYAKEIGAIFKQTSASNSVGINDLFNAVGKKYLDPSFKEEDTNEEGGLSSKTNGHSNNIKIGAEAKGKGDKEKKKKSFC